MEKFIHNRRNGVVYKCPDNIEDLVYRDFILLCSLRALDERWVFKEEQRRAQHIELDPTIIEKNTRRNCELNIVHELFVLHHQK